MEGVLKEGEEMIKEDAEEKWRDAGLLLRRSALSTMRWRLRLPSDIRRIT